MNTIEKILDLIDQSGESDYKLEQLIGLKRASINNWRRELANPKTDALIKIADYFHVSLDWLCDREGYATAITSEIQSLFDQLSAVRQEMLLDLARDFIKAEKKDAI